VKQGRLRRIRNWQSSEFYARLVMRPLTIAVLWFVGDWRFLTPNRVTTMANVAKLYGAALLVLDHRTYGLSAAVWLQIGLLLDHLDGTLARYRGTTSTFGTFYDKVSDAVTWLAITGAVGWAAYRDTGDARLPLAAVASGYALLVLGYMKWIVAAEQKKLDWLHARRVPRAIPLEGPPSRTPRQWAGWFVSSLLRVVMFEEVDLFFWIGLGLVVNQLELLCWLLVVSQGVQLIIMIIKRALQARALDDVAEQQSRLAA